MNKRILALLAILFLWQAGYAQTEEDALRYSYLTPGGTARMQSIGGAGISLGGDVSDMGSNPAGIGLFRTSDASITAGFQSKTDEGSYMGQSSSDFKNGVFLQQAGIVIASPGSRRRPSKWKNFSFGFGVNRLANFNETVYYQGENNESSYSDNYLIELAKNHESNYNNMATNYPFGISEGYLAGLIFPIENNGTFQDWYSLPSQVLEDGHSLVQSNSTRTKGGLNEVSLAVAGNYDNKLYLGLSLNVPSIKFDRSRDFRETNLTDKDALLRYYDVVDDLHTTGAGFNGKLGLIYAVNDKVRLGAAFHSPTIFSMHDTYTTSVVTSTTDQGITAATTTDVTGGYPGDYQYSMTTPWRASAGISVIFGTTPDVSQQHGFVTLDYEYVNYGAARYHFNASDATPDDKALADALNRSIGELYTGASNLRLGGEMKFDLLALRAGVAYMGSPYASDADGDQFRYSAGVGYRNRGFYADLTYVYALQNFSEQPYLIPSDNALGISSPPPVDLQSRASQILLTIGFKL